MKQRIVIKIEMSNEKGRVKVMKIIAKAHGVMSVAIEGPGKDRAVVVGDGVDSVELLRALRKNVGHASILDLQNVSGSGSVSVRVGNGYEHDEEHGSYVSAASTSRYSLGNSEYIQQRPPVQYYNVVHDPYNTNCSIL